MKRCCALSIHVLLPLLFFLLATSASATTVIMLSDDELIVDSRIILVGEVRSVSSVWDDNNSTIWTYVEISVSRLLKGNLDASDGRVVLKQPGGVVGELGIRVFGQPVFSEGQRLLLYLNPAPDGSLHVAHSFMGMFTIRRDLDTGQEWVSRNINAPEVEIIPRADSQSVTETVPLEHLLGKIVRTLEREAEKIRELDAMRSDEPLYSEPLEYEDVLGYPRGLIPAFSFIGGGVRWLEADLGLPVVLNYNPSRSPVSGGGATELGRGINAWPSQSGASIRLQLGSQTGSCGSVADGINTISFGDCLGQLDDPVGCSGVVAQTTVRWRVEEMIIGGRSFNRLIESDIVFNNGMDCFLGNSTNLAEVACHEVGHAIGLGHSTDSTAIMRSMAHGGGRDATLREDDRQGVLAIYPSGTGGGGSRPVSITTLQLSSATRGETYREELGADGGTPPYRWRLIGGTLSPGLTFSQSGVLEGIPATSGTFSFAVQVSDLTGAAGTDSRWFSLVVTSEPAGPTPRVTRVKVKNSKKLFVFGDNFTADTVIRLNGVLHTPKSIRDVRGARRLTFKGGLSLLGAGANVVIAMNSNGTSPPFAF